MTIIPTLPTPLKQNFINFFKMGQLQQLHKLKIIFLSTAKASSSVSLKKHCFFLLAYQIWGLVLSYPVLVIKFQKYSFI